MAAIKTVENEIVNGDYVVTTYYKNIKKTVTRLFNGKYKVCVYQLQCTEVSNRAIKVKPILIYSNITY